MGKVGRSAKSTFNMCRYYMISRDSNIFSLKIPPKKINEVIK